MMGVHVVGAALALVAEAALLHTGRGAAASRAARLIQGGRRFGLTGVGLAGIALLPPEGETGGLRAGLLLLAAADVALGLYLLQAGR